MASVARLGSVLTTGGNNELYIEGAAWTEEVEALVHLAQRFERDRLRAIGGIEIRWRDGASESLYRIPETLE